MPALAAPFYRLPLQVDGARLLAEVNALDPLEWRPDLFGRVTYSSLILVSHLGLDNDAQRSPWARAQRLDRLPYLEACLRTLGVKYAEVRLRWLPASSEIFEHYDDDLYWFSRYRLHIPIRTRPDARFLCDGVDVHMRTGECWLFDRLRLHAVHVGASDDRVHLIIDTLGGDRLDELIAAGEPVRTSGTELAPLASTALPTPLPRLLLEDEPRPFAVAEPTLFDRFMADLRARLGAAEVLDSARLSSVVQACDAASRAWAEAYARWGSREEGWPAFFEIGSTLANAIATIEADGPSTAIRPPLRERIRVFLTGALEPARQPPSQDAALTDEAQLRLQGELLLELGEDGVFVDARAGVDGRSFEALELLLLCAVARKLTPVEAADAIGLEHGEHVLELLREWMHDGLLERCHRPLRWPHLAPPGREESVTPEGEPMSARAIDPDRRFQVEAWPLHVRLLTNGRLGLWSRSERRYLALPTAFVLAFVALTTGISIAEACADGQIELDGNVMELVRKLEDASILRALTRS